MISGDQNLSTEGFIEFAADADVLVMPFAIPENAGRAARNLHATPSAIGKAAAETGAAHLVLSHFMARSLRDLDAQLDMYARITKGQSRWPKTWPASRLPIRKETKTDLVF